MSPIATETLSVAFDRVALKTQLRTDQEVVEALTLEEKISLLSGRSFCDTPGVPRLSVAPIKFSDGPSGMSGHLTTAYAKVVEASCHTMVLHQPCSPMRLAWRLPSTQH